MVFYKLKEQLMITLVTDTANMPATSDIETATRAATSNGPALPLPLLLSLRLDFLRHGAMDALRASFGSDGEHPAIHSRRERG